MYTQNFWETVRSEQNDSFFVRQSCCIKRKLLEGMTKHLSGACLNETHGYLSETEFEVFSRTSLLPLVCVEVPQNDVSKNNNNLTFVTFIRVKLETQRSHRWVVITYSTSLNTHIAIWGNWANVTIGNKISWKYLYLGNWNLERNVSFQSITVE